ncbi:MAG: dienelactone hydrolase family protein [Acidimicrobiales bacterium]
MVATRSEVHSITHRGANLEGVLVLPDHGPRPHPTVLVFGGWEGRATGVVDVANMVASMGYAAFAVDLYGDAIIGETNKACEALMAPFIDDRALLADRLHQVVEGVADLAPVDGDRLLAAGFCFGGLCVLDLARHNEPVIGVVSFHGVLDPPPATATEPIDPRVLVLHGWDDPLAPPEAVTALAAELSSREADWQLHGFGATMHAFMVAGADDAANGVQYNERSAGRAWAHFRRFLHECIPLAS